MKRIVGFIFALTILFAVNFSVAQETENTPTKPGWFVMSQNMVSLSDVSELNVLSDSLFVPILSELVDEGKLLSYGLLDHAWGDEWNYNVYYVTKDHAAFIEFFNEYVKRVTEKHPDALPKVISLIKAHKDNMYSIR